MTTTVRTTPMPPEELTEVGIYRRALKLKKTLDLEVAHIRQFIKVRETEASYPGAPDISRTLELLDKAADQLWDFADRIEPGKAPKEGPSKRPRWTPKVMAEIEAEVRKGTKQVVLARRYGVSEQYMSDLIKRIPKDGGK